ncbi:hypothetical protein EPUS_07750 [Endocarpon pusillum Z07020]|uniref:15-O-acetyltransferase Tri3 n=1 Tax=Endocarpon pusillum (strain Z07020 / HMAS-L-300199) TaxID=1263415 RepID=U1GG38_ENDPU|nr:uncharacterized protein EPUS_07750 [Endocarpon pusillum Z07020]ERF71078.1 hypothetical protein EPUS_07750 [Endocarpon pusillum Z07020]
MPGRLPEVPPLAPETYRWEKSKTDPRVLQRRANGAEVLVGIRDNNIKGQYDLYLMTTLRINNLSTATALSLSSLKEKLQPALLEIRFKHPEIACTVLWDNQVAPVIQYTPPENSKDAHTWAHNTVHILATSKTGVDARTEVEQRRRLVGSQPAKPVSIYIVADVANEDTPLTPGTVVDVLMHMNHLYWDGISVRMFAGDLLRSLSQNLGVEQKPSQYQWGEEIANLGVPVLDALDIDIGSLGDDFNTARDDNVRFSWGLRCRAKTGTPRTIFHTFTVPESETMIRAVKSRLGPKYTISHLGHAATVLALLKANPPSNDIPDSQSLIMPIPVNGRRWLRDDHARDYYGMCQTGAVIKIKNIKFFMVDGNDRDAVVEALERGCKLVKEAYDHWMSKPFLLALGISKDNFIASYLTSPKESVPFGGMAHAIFVSDGMNDRFIPGDVTSAATGEKLMSVENVSFFLNKYLPSMSFRLDSWKGASTLSLCYNDGSYTAEEATTWLQYLATYMLAFAQ